MMYSHMDYGIFYTFLLGILIYGIPDASDFH